MSERPVEPYNTSDNPEQWALIANWEWDRAEAAEAAMERVRSITVDEIVLCVTDYYGTEERNLSHADMVENPVLVAEAVIGLLTERMEWTK